MNKSLFGIAVCAAAPFATAADQGGAGNATATAQKITRAGTQASTAGPAEHFTGRVRVDRLFSTTDDIQRAQQTAMMLAERLEIHPLVTRVRYPGLLSHPTHATAKRVLQGFGTIISFDLLGGAEFADGVCQNVRLIRHATSRSRSASSGATPRRRNGRPRRRATDAILASTSIVPASTSVTRSTSHTRPTSWECSS